MRNLNSARSPATNNKTFSMFDDFQDVKLIKTEGQSQRTIRELLQTNQPTKIIKLVKQASTNLLTTQQLLEEQQLTGAQALQLFLKVEAASRSEDTRCWGHVINFLHLVKDMVTQSAHQTATKVQILLLCMGYSGSLGRIDEVLLSQYELIQLRSLVNMESHLKETQNDSGVNLNHTLTNVLNQSLRTSFLVTVLFQNSNHYASPLFTSAVKLTVQDVHSLESLVLLNKHSPNIRPNQVQIRSLILSYLMMVLQIQISIDLRLTKECMEQIGNVNDTPHNVMRGFMRNATRLAFKFIKSPPIFHERISGIFDKYNHDDLINLLAEELDLEFINSAQFKEMIVYYATQQSLCSATRHENHIIHKLIPIKLKDIQKPSSKRNLLKPEQKDDVRISPLSRSAKSIQIQMKTEQTFIQQPLIRSNSKLTEIIDPINLSDSRSKGGNEEIEYLFNEVEKQKREIQTLKTNPMTERRSSAEVDKLKEQFKELRTTVDNIKPQEKDSEVKELKDMVGKLSEQLQTLEKFIKNDIPQPIQRFSVQSNIQTPRQVQIPTRFRGRPSLESRTDDFYTDETSPFTKNVVTSLLEAGALESGVGLSKIFTIHRSDEDIWEQEHFEQTFHKVDAQFIDAIEGRSLQIRQFSQEELISTEIIPPDTVKTLLHLLEVDAVTPTSMPLRCIQSSHDFLKYYILPFVAVKDQTIQIWPKAPGCLFGLELKLEFLDLLGLIFFHHIEADSFRIVIYNPDSSDYLKIDVEMDYSSMDFLFENVKDMRDEYVHQQKLIMMNMTEPTEDDNYVRRGFIRANKTPKQQKVFKQELLQIKRRKELLILIKKCIQTLDGVLSKTTKSFQELQEGLRYYKYRTWNNTSRGQIQIVTDQQTHFDVELANSHETFGPAKTKLKAQGHSRYMYDSLKRDFGLNAQSLSSDEKLAIMSCFLYSYTLQTMEKATENTQDIDRNPIIFTPLECGQYQRVAMQSQYGVTVVTTSIVGNQRRMLGVKVCSFDHEECIEQGIFLTVTQTDWDLRSVDKQHKQKITVDNIPFSEYFLMQIFPDKRVQKALLNKFWDSRRHQIDKLDNVLHPDM